VCVCVCVCARVRVLFQSKQCILYSLSRKKDIVSSDFKFGSAAFAYAWNNISSTLRHKGAHKQIAKNEGGSGTAAIRDSWLIYRNTSENNFAAALLLPSPSVVSKESVKLSACWILQLGAFAQKKCVFSPPNDLVRNFAKKLST